MEIEKEFKIRVKEILNKKEENQKIIIGLINEFGSSVFCEYHSLEINQKEIYFLSQEKGDLIKNQKF